MPWAPTEGGGGGGGGRHSTSLFLTYATRLTFLNFGFCEIKKKLAYFLTIVIFCYYQLHNHNLLSGDNSNKGFRCHMFGQGRNFSACHRRCFSRYAPAYHRICYTTRGALAGMRKKLNGSSFNNPSHHG